MFQLRFDESCAPSYMTEHSVGADLKARIDVTVAPGQRALVPTGTWIADVDWAKVPCGAIPELQVRARSGLAWKHGICLANGVGTIDADYRDEICALLLNTTEQAFTIKAGERVAQLVFAIAYRIDSLSVGGARGGGFGSTGRS